MKHVSIRACIIFFALLVFAIEGKAQLTVSIPTSTDLTCFGFCTGSATCQPSGGVPPYTYAWTPSSATTQTMSAVCAGAYTVTVTDAAFATATATVLITQPALLSAGFPSSSAISCNSACDGSITVSASGGTPPYAYAWSPAGGNAAVASSLCAATYTATITDMNGCSLATGFTLNQPNFLVADAGVSQAICYGASTTLNGSATGGTPPFTYAWSGPLSFTSSAASPLVTPSATSIYSLTLTDANGCTSFDTVMISLSQSLNLSFSTINATCAQSDGLISVLPSGGVAPYAYLWNNSVTNDTNNNVPAGIYTVTVTDANGCSNTAAGAISNITGPTLSVSGIVNPTCYNGSNGSATVVATGGPQPYTYLWNSSPAQTTATATNLPAGNFFCTVVDANNCQSSISATLAQPAQLYLGAQSISGANCINNGSARAWASGGVLPYSYVWSNTETGDTAYALPSGNCTVTVTDNTGCAVSGSISIASTNATLVTGKVYNDINANCVFDAGDFAIANQLVVLTPNNQYCYTDSLGEYRVYPTVTGQRNAVVNYNYSNPYTSAFCPANSTIPVNVIALCDTISNIDFGRSLIPGMQDLRISLAVPLSPRPGFQNSVYITYWNVGSVTVPNTTVNLAFDSILTFISASQTPSINNIAYLEWNTGTLVPGQQGTIHVLLQVPTIPNGGYLGRPMDYYAAINPYAGDQTQLDNGDEDHRVIVGSWDPNDKACYTPGIDSLGNITPADSILSYTVRFQNTGTDTAYTVYVEDTLSPYLDPATIIPGAASHPYTFTMSGSGIMRFDFHTIMLPDSNHNEPLSHGFFKYTVKRLPGLPIGTTIENTAYIYFDFNPAVITNTTSNTIAVPSGISENIPGEISAYPNPFDESVTLIVPENFKGKNCEVTLTDVQGRVVLTQQKQNANSIIIQRGQLEAGIYFCTIRCEGQAAGNKKLIIK
jgi:hypothetical protein